MLQTVAALKQHRENVVNLRGVYGNPENTKTPPNVGLMLGLRRRRWANINTTAGRHVNWGSVSHIKAIQLKLIGHLY